MNKRPNRGRYPSSEEAEGGGGRGGGYCGCCYPQYGCGVCNVSME